jgi:threonine synthase
MMHGATVIQIQGNFDDALKMVIDIAQHYPISLVNSVNPYRLKGQMTAAFEIIEALGEAPDYHFLPVGNAGNISAYWMGYKIYHESKKSSILPKMMGFQASGAAPLVLGRPVKKPETIATAIRIGNPASWDLAIAARDKSKGLIDKVNDREILKAYDCVARLEGYFCEPASAAGVAGIMKLAQKNYFQAGQKIVCTLTGHGLKDPDVAVGRAKKPASCSADLKAIVKKIGF